jgi:hypothetical protein
VANIDLGPFNTCNANGDKLLMVPRCYDEGATEVPGVVVNVTQQHLAMLNVQPYNSKAPNMSACVRASLCGMGIPADTELTLSWVQHPTFTAPGPEGPTWETCAHDNCPAPTVGGSNIIIPNTGNPAGELLQIQSNLGNGVSGIAIVLRISDCRYSAPVIGPL